MDDQTKQKKEFVCYFNLQNPKGLVWIVPVKVVNVARQRYRHDMFPLPETT